MTSDPNPQNVRQGHFSALTLRAIIDVTRKDVQNIEFAIAAAKKAGASTHHWDERLRQTNAVLMVALKEFAQFAEQPAYA